jgi:hypothetical protein
MKKHIKNKTHMKKFEMLLKLKLDDERRYKQDKAKVFCIIIGQCTTAMKHKVQNSNSSEYIALEKADNVIGLLMKMREFAYTTENVQYEYWTMQASVKTLFDMRQQSKESLNGFGNLKRCIAQLEVTEDVWGGELIPMKLKGKTTALQTKGRNKFLACLFLAGVDQDQYGKVVDKLNNDHLQGANCYPKDVPSTMALLNNRRDDHGGSKESNIGDDSSVQSEKTVMSFLQEGRRWFCCGSKTHLASTCPDRNKTPRTEWFIRKKKMQHFQSDESSQEGDDTDGEDGITGGGVVGWNM